MNKIKLNYNILEAISYNEISEKKRFEIILSQKDHIIPEDIFNKKTILKNIIENNYEIEINEIKKILKKISEDKKRILHFKNDKKTYIIGDLHQDLYSLDTLLKTIDLVNNYENIRLVFLGDYIDRGTSRFSLIQKILLLKFILPDNVFLLRGNHELYKVENNEYHTIMANADMSYFFELLTFLQKSDKEEHKNIVKSGYDEELIKNFAEFFDTLPILVFFNYENIKILGVHGGLPRFKKIDELPPKIENLFKLNDIIGIPQWKNMLWSDPTENEKFFKLTSEIRFKFSKNMFVDFCKKYDIDIIVRSHEAFKNGYEMFFDKRLLTIFSNGGKNDSGEEINEESAYSFVRPAFAEIRDNEILIKSNFGHLLDEIKYDEIKNTKKEQENFKKIYITEYKKQDNLFCKPFKIFDYNNPLNSKFLDNYIKDNILFLNYQALANTFYGINLDFALEFDMKKNILKNTGKLPFGIGINGPIIHTNDEVTIKDNFIIVLNKEILLYICWK